LPRAVLGTGYWVSCAAGSPGPSRIGPNRWWHSRHPLVQTRRCR